jgi:hypothetical protein
LIERDGALVLMNHLRIPRLTASTDAVLALIGERLAGYKGRVDFGWRQQGAYIWEPGPDGEEIAHAAAATPALALLAAALEAMAVERGQTQQQEYA